MKYIFIFIFLILQLNSKESKQYDLEDIIKKTNTICVGRILKVDVHLHSYIYYQIELYNLYIEDSVFIKKKDIIDVFSQHHSYGFLSLSELFNTKILFLTYDSIHKNYQYLFSFDIVNISKENIVDSSIIDNYNYILIPELNRFAAPGFYDMFSVGFGRFDNLLPKNISIELNMPLPQFRRFVPLRYLLDYIKKVNKSKKNRNNKSR